MPVPTNPTFPVIPGFTLPKRTALWRTNHQESLAGVDCPVDLWTYPRYRYELTAEFLRVASAYGELATLLGFFNSVRSSQVFMYTDPDDKTTIADQGFGTGDGVDATFQLVRSVGGFAEPVFAVNAITNLKVSGVAKSSPADYSVDAKGLVTFVAPPAAAAPLTWTGTYLWFCRLDQDELQLDKLTAAADSQGPIYALSKLGFTTIKMGS